jgi:hypothetical protein
VARRLLMFKEWSPEELVAIYNEAYDGDRVDYRQVAEKFFGGPITVEEVVDFAFEFSRQYEKHFGRFPMGPTMARGDCQA